MIRWLQIEWNLFPNSKKLISYDRRFLLRTLCGGTLLDYNSCCLKRNVVEHKHIILNFAEIWRLKKVLWYGLSIALILKKKHIFLKKIYDNEFKCLVTRDLSAIVYMISVNGPSKFCGRQPLKKLKRYGDHTPSNFLKVVFHKFYSVHSWIFCPV